MREGWMCPACSSAHAPDVQTCPVEVRGKPPCQNCQDKGFIYTHHEDGRVSMVTCMECAADRAFTFGSWCSHA